MDITEARVAGIGNDGARMGQFAALCLTKAVMMSFCASSIARLAVDRCAPESVSGYFIDRKSISVTLKFWRSEGQTLAMSAVKSAADMPLVPSREYSRARQFQ